MACGYFSPLGKGFRQNSAIMSILLGNLLFSVMIGFLFKTVLVAALQSALTEGAGQSP